jgi:hypothetical protein
MPKTAAKRRSDAVPSRPNDAAVTIGGGSRVRLTLGQKLYGTTGAGICWLSHIAAPACDAVRPR